MPTLPLMTPTPHANASRKITAPGGYEWWGFDASSDDGRLHLVAALHAGNAFDGAYARRYAMYRRWPTRVAPPTPGDFVAVTFALLEQGRPALRFSMPVSREEFTAAEDGRRVRAGASHVDRASDGVLRVSLRGIRHDRTIAVNLAFRPIIEASGEINLSSGGAATSEDDAGLLSKTDAADLPATTPTMPDVPDAGEGQHGWVIVNPLCDVDGEISVFEESGGPPRVTAFAGSGCHEHRWGTRPLAEVSDRWVRGRAVFEDHAVLFQRLADGRSFICEAHKGSSPRVRGDGRLKTTGSGMSRWGVGYPETIEIPGHAGDVRFMRPRVVGASIAGVTVAYDAVGDLETGRALVEVVKPRRLRWASR